MLYVLVYSTRGIFYIFPFGPFVGHFSMGVTFPSDTGILGPINTPIFGMHSHASCQMVLKDGQSGMNWPLSDIKHSIIPQTTWNLEDFRWLINKNTKNRVRAELPHEHIRNIAFPSQA